MGKVIVTLKIMPSSVDVNLDNIKGKTTDMISGFGADLMKEEIEPVAFGLKSLNLTLVFDEEKGSTDSLEEQIAGIEGVQSCEAISVRRAMG